MSDEQPPARRPSPPNQYLPPEQVIDAMGEFGLARVLHLSTLRILLLAILAGGFITLGALFSVLLATGVESEGAVRLMEGLGFSTGFFFVILAGAVLFTEANVVAPAALLSSPRAAVRLILQFWVLAWVGNFLGALVTGAAINVAQDYSPAFDALLREIVDTKLAYRDEGGIAGWGKAVLSGVLANWIVGMAAFFATMGRTIIGKYIPVFLAVTLFVSAGFQHSPANMGFFSIIMPTGEGPGWDVAFAWNIIPAGIGNILGGVLLVALPFWFIFSRLGPEARDAAGE